MLLLWLLRKPHVWFPGACGTVQPTSASVIDLGTRHLWAKQPWWEGALHPIGWPDDSEFTSNNIDLWPVSTWNTYNCWFLSMNTTPLLCNYDINKIFLYAIHVCFQRFIEMSSQWLVAVSSSVSFCTNSKGHLLLWEIHFDQSEILSSVDQSTQLRIDSQSIHVRKTKRHQMTFDN